MNMYTSRRKVEGESPASTRTVQFAEKVEVSLSQKKMEKSEACGSLENVEELEEEEEGTALGADPSTGHVKINAMN